MNKHNLKSGLLFTTTSTAFAVAFVVIFLSGFFVTPVNAETTATSTPPSSGGGGGGSSGGGGGGGSSTLVPLWTQVNSNFPSQVLTSSWSGQPYASGIDHSCGDKNNNYSATIGRCGCLITSFVMLSHYYAIDNDISGSNVTPLAMNNWLIAHDGYANVTHNELNSPNTTNENLLDWNAALKYLGATIGGKTYTQLQYQTVNGTKKITDSATIDNYLAQLNPAIIYNALVGHFLVMASKLPNAQPIATYTVRDPFFFNTQTLNDIQNPTNHVHAYNNNFSYAVIPTKLAQPQLVVANTTLYLASPAEFLVTDPLGNKTGEDPQTNTSYNQIPGATYELSDPIVTSDVELDQNSLPHTKVLYLPSLTNGVYDIQVIGTDSGTYQFTAVMTSDLGTTTTKIFTASTTLNAITDYVFSVSTTSQDITLTADELISSLMQTIQNSSIKPAVKVVLLAEMQAIKITNQQHKSNGAEALIDLMIWEVKRLKGTTIPAPTADILLQLLSDLRKMI